MHLTPPAQSGGAFVSNQQEKEDTMSAKLIFDHALIGAIIAYSDGTPRPPDRHRRELADWKNRNGSGRLCRAVRK